MDIKLLAEYECHVWWADAQDLPTEVLRADLSAMEIVRAIGYRRIAACPREAAAEWRSRIGAFPRGGPNPMRPASALRPPRKSRWRNDAMRAGDTATVMLSKGAA